MYQIMMVTGVILAMYPLWPPTIRQEVKETIVQVAYPITIFYMLVVFNFFFLLISNFGSLQFSVFTLNLVICSVVVGWRLAAIMIICGIFVAGGIFSNFFNHYSVTLNIGSPGFICTYILMLFAASLVIFIKPKQEQQELAEKKNEHLSDLLSFQAQELQEALGLKAEFLRNISHEYHTPLTGVISMSEILQSAYDKLSDKQRKQAIDDIVKSAARLDCFDTNINILAGISKGKLELNIQLINLSELVLARVEICQKLYDGKPENHEIILHIAENVQFNGDKDHLTKAIDNLIMNSLQYCKKGKIEITLKEEDKKIAFKIADEGIGIPQNELSNIFDEFKVSSKTHTPSGGRGIGLTVAQKIIELHGGKIWAESDGSKGATFVFRIASN
jgi:signal transduction histidine kinase